MGKNEESFRSIEGQLSAKGLHVGVVVSRFNSFITDRLLGGCLDALRRLGGDEADIAVARVPGSLEIAVAARAMAQSGAYDAVICLGAVIRGDTYHFEVVASESARGVMDVALESGLPIANGILTTDDEAQAKARLAKGAEAVQVALEMAKLKAKLHEER